MGLVCWLISEKTGSEIWTGNLHDYVHINRNLLSHFFGKNFVKLTCILKNYQRVDLTKYFFSESKFFILSCVGFTFASKILREINWRGKCLTQFDEKTKTFRCFQFKCCGVNNYTDWKNPGTIYHDNINLEVPESCCDGFEPSIVNECRQNPDDDQFKSQMKGCFTIFKNSLEKSKGTIVVVGGTIIGAIVSFLLFLHKRKCYIIFFLISVLELGAIIWICIMSNAQDWIWTSLISKWVLLRFYVRF